MRNLFIGLICFMAACANEEFTAPEQSHEPQQPEQPAQSLPVASITLSAPASLEIGDKIQIGVELKDGAGKHVERDVRFISSHPDIAAISESGLLTGLSSGTVEISATSESKSAAIQLQVRKQPGCEQASQSDRGNSCEVVEVFELISYQGVALPVHSPWGNGDWDYDEDAGTWNLIAWSYSFYTDATYATILTHRAASGALHVETSSGTYTRTNSSVELKPFGGAAGSGSIADNRLTIGDFVFARK